MTAADVRTMLKDACRKAGTSAAWAAKHGLSQAYVSDAINGRRDPGPAICKALGIEAGVSYRKVRS
jgi:DNA-binding transcriptional regulator YdaS (Cro superfamily)